MQYAHASTTTASRWVVVVAAVLALAGCGGDNDAADHGPTAGPTAGPAAAGRDLYESQACVRCHSVDGFDGRGPTFAGLWDSQVELADGSTVTADRGYIATAVREPEAQISAGYSGGMPAYDLTGDQLDALIAYLRTLDSQ